MPHLQLIRRLRARIIAALDRPGGRWLLATLATLLSRRGDRDAAIVHRGVWFARYRGDVLPVTGSRAFTYRNGDDVRGAYEWQFEEVRDMWLPRYEPEPGDVIVDVGAGVGTETYVLARAVGPAGQVIAVEPHPETFRVLAAQVQANGLDNVILERCAVTAAAGEVYIENRERHERNTVSAERSEGRLEEPVPGSPLDELRRRHNLARIDFLKMNIEGAERDALAGMSEAIAVTRHVCIACHDFLADSGAGEEMRTREEVTRFLADHGFRIERRVDDPRPFVRDHVHAVREDNGRGPAA